MFPQLIIAITKFRAKIKQLKIFWIEPCNFLQTDRQAKNQTVVVIPTELIQLSAGQPQVYIYMKEIIGL